MNGRMAYLKTNAVNDWLINHFDICFITETHMTKGELFILHSYLSFHNAYSQQDCRYPRGGISCFIKKTFMKNVLHVNTSIENFIILTLIGNHTLFGVYIEPSDSIYYDESLFAELSNLFTQLIHVML